MAPDMERTAWLLAVVAAMVTAEGGGNELPGWSDKFVREIIGSDGYVVVFFSCTHPPQNCQFYIVRI
jgi:hypothetical protein